MSIETVNPIQIEQMYLHPTGVVLALTPELSAQIASATLNGSHLSPEVQVSLRVLDEDPIMRSRYPSVQDGNNYMRGVCFTWRKYLWTVADKVSDCIVSELADMGKTRSIKTANGTEKVAEAAIVLYGSVAKGLVRHRGHDDPSNIDLAVVGDFTLLERDELFDRIRPCRKLWQNEIGNNIGVHIQTPERLTNGNYWGALNYEASMARALYDPCDIWKSIRADALEDYRERLNSKMLKDRIKFAKGIMWKIKGGIDNLSLDTPIR